MTSIIIADTLPEELPTLYEGPAMNLPPGAELKGDGSVTLTLAYPKTLRFRKGDAEETLPIDTLTFRRMNGAQARKIVNAKDKGVVGFSAATGVTPARANLIINALDAADGMDAAEVVNELLGGAGVGLPDNAVSTPDGVTLSLLFPVAGEDGTEHAELFFPRMTVQQRNQAQAQPDILDHVVAKVAGVSAKQARDLLDKMDGADFRSVNRVVLFLFGVGR
jgi:hypothetical protein